MKTTIFYFSGTGNSLFVARKLAEKLEDCSVQPIATFSADGQIGGEGERVGFVFPSYYGNLPRIVRRFVDGVEIDPKTWLFGVVTMGAPFGMGNGCASELEKALAKKGLTLRYSRGVSMPRNYVLKYNPLSSEKGAKYNAKADGRTSKIAKEIKSEKSKIQKCFITSDDLYGNIETLDEKFFTEDSCCGCGQCEMICPVKNIKMVDDHPEWQHHCEHCIACISWCHDAAIQYGEKTKERGRYHNPEIEVSELLVSDY